MTKSSSTYRAVCNLSVDINQRMYDQYFLKELKISPYDTHERMMITGNCHAMYGNVPSSKKVFDILYNIIIRKQLKLYYPIIFMVRR